MLPSEIETKYQQGLSLFPKEKEKLRGGMGNGNCISENVINKWGRQSCVPFICNTFCSASWQTVWVCVSCIPSSLSSSIPIPIPPQDNPSLVLYNWRSFYLFRIVAWYKWLAINASWVYCLCSLACGKRIIEKGHSADDIRVLGNMKGAP